MNDNDRLMEWIHLYRLDSAKHHLQAIWGADLNRICSFEAAMFFTDTSVVTINCELR
jgi:hypothetical protein